MSDLSDTIPVHVRRIHVVGNQRVHTEYLQQQLNTLTDKPHTFNELRHLSNSALQRLHDTRLFDRVTIDFDRSSAEAAADSNAVPAKAVLTVQEKRSKMGGLTATGRAEQAIQTGESLGSIEASYRNAFGRNERIDASVQYGSEQSRAFALGLNKPVYANGKYGNLYTELFSKVDNHSYLSSFNARLHGIHVSAADESNTHRLVYEAVQRDIAPVQRAVDVQTQQSGVYTGPSVSILRSVTSSLKSSLKYVYTRNTTDNLLSATKGTYTQFSTEVAGLGGDVKFVKNEVDVKHYIPINKNVTAGLSLLAGAIQPLSSHIHTVAHNNNNTNSNSLLSKPQSLNRTHLIDRFILGGPMLLKGFRPAGVGPRDGLDALGGDMYAGVGAHVSTMLPFDWCKQYNVRGQVFINAGNLISLPTLATSPASSHSVSEQAGKFVQTARLSGGVGLVAPTPLGRLEVSLSVPVLKQPTDQQQQFGYGIALKFL